MRDHLEFIRQCRDRFDTTGAIAPSGRFLAATLTKPLSQHGRPVRVLEVGPGTGAVTRSIVRLLKPDDHFDLVELNETFVAVLKRNFEKHPDYQRVAAQSRIHNCPLEDFPHEGTYDFVISGLPHNNFPPDVVARIFETYFQLLSPGGVLSYFEYMFIRPVKRRISGARERARFGKLDEIVHHHFRNYRFRREWVYRNIPPAWVHHLRAPDEKTPRN